MTLDRMFARMMVRKGGGRSPGGMMSKKKSGGRRDGRKVVEKKAKRGGKTKFEEFLERDMKKSAHMQATADDDLALERRLAKKLKVKGGKLGGFDDGMADILDGLEEEVGVLSPPQLKGSKKSLPKKVESEDDEESSGSEMEEEDASDGDVESGDAEESGSDIEGEELNEDAEEDDEEEENDEEEESDEENDEEEESDEENDDDEDDGMSSASEEEVEEEMPTKGKKMLKDTGKPSKEAKNNKNKDENNAAVKYVPPHLREKASSESEEMARIQRRVRGLLNRLSEANVESISSEVSLLFQAHGRRMVTEIITNEIIGACCGGPRGNDQYAAVFAAYIAGTAAMVGMDFGAKFLGSLASAFEEQYAKEDSLALRNLTLLFANLYSFSLLPSELVYEVLGMLCKRFEELDVATILTLLQSCGMGLRAADPASMKEFVVSVQQRTSELKASLSSKNGGIPVDLGKRVQFMLDMICDIKNNKRRPKDDPAHHIRLKKWLQKLGVEDVQLRSVTWVKLMDTNKKGQWWLPGVADGAGEDLASGKAEIAGVMDSGGAEADKMLQLAASQRMNTDARRSLFCIIMSAEDYLDAFEKILRLKLPGKQDREVVRVIVECCLQEQYYNKYYALLLTKLCHHEKNHKFSFQYCLWDHLKQLDSMELRRSTNLARLTASLIGSFSLSLSIVKVVDFIDIQKLAPKVVIHFRIMFECMLTEYKDDIIWAIFSRIAIAPELAALRDGLGLFLQRHIVRELKKGDPVKGALLGKRCKLAKKGLANVAGVPFGSQTQE